MEYVLISLTTNEILDRKNLETPPPDISHKGMRWLPLIVIRPACDINTQIEEGPVITVTDTDVTMVYTVRDLTPEELYNKRFNDINNELFGAGKFAGTAQLYVFNQTRISQGLVALNNNEFVDLIVQSLTPPATSLND